MRTYKLTTKYYVSFLLGTEVISSQLLSQKESNAMSARETISLNEENIMVSSAVIPCRTAKDLEDLTEDLNSVKHHMQQNEDTHKNDCFIIQSLDTSDHAVESLAMSAFALWKVIKGDTTNNTGKFSVV